MVVRFPRADDRPMSLLGWLGAWTLTVFWLVAGTVVAGGVIGSLPRRAEGWHVVAPWFDCACGTAVWLASVPVLAVFTSVKGPRRRRSLVLAVACGLLLPLLVPGVVRELFGGLKEVWAFGW